MAAPKEFGRLLTEAIYYVKAREDNKNISIIQDELGYALGKEGRSSIEYWRGGRVPSKDQDVEILARELVKNCGDSLGREWLQRFLESADYPFVEDLCNELFPLKQVEQDTAKPSPPEYQPELSPKISAPSSSGVMEWLNPPKGLVVILIPAIIVFLIFYRSFDPTTNNPNGFVAVKPTSTATSALEPTLIPASVATSTVEYVSICGEFSLVELPGGEFLYHQGVTSFTTENTHNGISYNRVRSLEIAPEGVLIGYGYTDDEETPRGGLTYLAIRDRKKFWANCDQAGVTNGKYVNSIAVDENGHIWVATDGSGVLMYDGEKWVTFTIANTNLPDDHVFGLIVADDNTVWAATWQGIARFDGSKWAVVYDSEDELEKNPVHNLAFDSVGNVWIGHIFDGVSQFSGSEGVWNTYLVENGSGISGNQVRGIVVREASDNYPESVWFATDDGGVFKHENGSWKVYGIEDGLPSEHVRTITVDKYGRVWVGTDAGVAYLEGTHWEKYHSLSTLSIAIGPGCLNPSTCPLDDHVWTATEEFGLTHSRLPYPSEAIDVTQICFESRGKNPVCPTIEELQYPHIITATYPIPLEPGEIFHFEIQVSPRGGYELREDYGDFLSFVDENEENLFGSHWNVPVKGTISPGQRFILSTHDTVLTAPTLPQGVEEATFMSPWRVWMHTRYTGPEVHIVFTVKQP